MTSWIDIGGVDDIPALGARVVHTAAGDIAVFRDGQDRVRALKDRCPHKGGPLSQGIVHGEHVTCPMHSWCIHLESGEAAAPDRGCARPCPVKVEGRRVWLKVPEENSP
ncbi:MAG: nitrite reductase small subunit NirD [Magnetospirillum sp. WYHS-4]